MKTAVGDISLQTMPFDSVIPLNGPLNVAVTVLHFNSSAILTGLQQFACSGCVQVLHTDLIGGPLPDTAILNLTMSIFNPSSANLVLGRVQMLLDYNQVVIGNGTIANTTLNRGPNVYPVVAYFTVTPQNKAQAIGFLSTFLKGAHFRPTLCSPPSLTLWGLLGGSLNVTLLGFEGGTDVIYAKKAFAHLRSPTVVPGFKDKLIERADLFLSWRLFQGQLPTQLHLFNPFNSTVSIMSCTVDIFYKGTKLGHLQEDLKASPIVLPPNSHVLGPQLNAVVDNVDISFLNSLFGILPVDVNGSCPF